MILNFFNIRETDLIAGISDQPFGYQFVYKRGYRLPARSYEAGNILMSEIIGNAYGVGRVGKMFLRQLPKEIDKTGFYVFVQQVQQPVLNMPELVAYLFTLFERQSGFFLQQVLKIIY